MIIFIRDYFNSEVKILLRNLFYAFVPLVIIVPLGIFVENIANSYFFIIPYVLILLIILLHLIILLFKIKFLRSIIGIGIIGLLGSGLWLWTYTDIGVPLNEAFDLTVIAWYISSSILLFGILNKEDSSLRFCIIFSIVWFCIWAAINFYYMYDNSYVSSGYVIFRIIFNLQPIIWFVFLNPNRK